MFAAMRSAFGWIIALFAAFWMFRAITGIVRDLTGPAPLKWVIGAMGLLVVLGSGGFFASALSALGMLKLPDSFEWRAGYVRGVVQTADGKYVVPLILAGRVQMYDSNWRFLRGWNVDAAGGDFKVDGSQPRIVEVLTARGRHHYSFTDDGRLISATNYSEDFYTLGGTEQSVIVPTSPLLWVFSSPFLCMGLAIIGFVGLSIVKNLAQS